MPSLAQGYGRGLLFGLQMQEKQRGMKEDDLLEEIRREQLEDMRFRRKTLMSELKEKERKQKEKAKLQEMVGDIAGVEAGGLMSGQDFIQSLLGGEETPPETKERLTSAMDYVPGLSMAEQFQRTRVKEKVEGAPGAIPFDLGVDVAKPSGPEKKAERKLQLKEYGEAGAGPQERRDVRLLQEEFPEKEEKPKEWTGDLNKQYAAYVRDFTATDNQPVPLSPAEWYEETGIGQPIPEPDSELEMQEEDNFIKQAQGENQTVDSINWDAVTEKWPNLNIEYIKSKL